MIPEKYQWITQYSPLAWMITGWRDLLMNNVINYPVIAEFYLASAVILILGVMVFNKLKFRFAEIL